LSCDRWGVANLDSLIQIGKGNKSVTEARFRCKDCGVIVQKQLRPPVPRIGGAVAYMSLDLRGTDIDRICLQAIETRIYWMQF